MNPAQRRSAALGRGTQTDAIEESVESKAVRQWQSREELRALSAANKAWGLTKATKTGQGALSMTPGSPGSRSDLQAAPGNMNDQIAHLNRPMNDNASLDERRAEVKRRIAEAQQLRLSLQQNGAAGLPEAAGRPGATTQAMMSPQMAPAAPQRAQAPANVVGYPKKNQYDADTAGKIKVPPGTEITTTLMKKGISDYPGSSLKAIANRDVYDTTRQFVIIPKGTEFNIKMVRTRNVNEAISNRVGFLVKEAVLPNGNSIDFSTASVSDREGVGAIEDQTNYHLMAQFLGVAAYALVGSQTSRSGTGDQESSYAGDVGENSRSQFAPLAEKYLNIVPTQTIRPGQSFQIITEQEMFIEPWSDLYAKYVD
jgi:type IV secretion system protein TrbI